MAVRIKLPYETPLIVDLNEGQALAATTNCKKGAAVQQTQCSAGGSPAQECRSGSVALGGRCQPGSVASSSCNPGSSAQSRDCKAGSAATALCGSGSVAGGPCTFGNAVAS